MDQSQPSDEPPPSQSEGRDEALRRSDEQFRLLVEEVTEYAIFCLDPDGRVASWNRGAERIKGYCAEEILGRHFSRFYTAEDVEAGLPACVLEAAARDGQWTGEGWRVRRDGSRFWAHVTITALTGEEGALHGFAKVTRDMTEPHRREEKLRKSEEKFRVLAERALVGVALFRGGIYEYVNPAFAGIVGYEPGELIGQSPEMLFHPDDWPFVQRQMEKRFAGETDEAHYEARVVTKSGEVRTLEIRGSLFDYRGEPALLATMLDVTERRQLQREVLRMQEEERRRIGQDLHDGLASQLTGVDIMLDVIAGRVDDDEELVGDIQEIRKLVTESSQDVRRLSRGLAPAGLSWKEFPSALDRLAKNVEGGRFEKDADLPEFAGDVAAHLYWIAQEAVANARKHAAAGEVVIRLLRAGDALVLEVEDDGRGFDADRMDAERVGADGLGLRTMRYRAELLSAELRVESSPGMGTRVTCRLPT